MTGRRTIVVHTQLGGHTVRVEATRAGANGVRVLTMGHLAARLAGGSIQPIDPEALHQAVRDSIAANDLGELEAIKALPGMARAVVGTLEKVWRAEIELSTSSHPRLRALAALERDVLRRLRSQPAAPRWENAPTLREIIRLTYALTDLRPHAMFDGASLFRIELGKVGGGQTDGTFRSPTFGTRLHRRQV